MRFDLHQQFVQSLDTEAENLLPHFGPSTSSAEYPQTRNPRNISADHVVQITDDDDVFSGRAGEDGQTIASYVNLGNEMVGLEGEHYSALLALVNKLVQRKELRNHLSSQSVEKEAIRWMKARVRGTTSLQLTNFVLWSLGDDVVELEIWIPIAYTTVESDLHVGKVVFKTITSEMIHRWNAVTVKKSGRRIVDPAIEHLIVGLAAATLKVTAEPEKAYEIAAREVAVSVAVLRFFSLSANWSPFARSYSVPLGREYTERDLTFAVDGFGMLRHISHGEVDGTVKGFDVTDKLADLIRQVDFVAFDELLRSPTRSEFEESLIASWLLYSNHSVAPKLTERIVYLFGALEMLLLKDGQEGILASVPDRMAFLLANSKDERLAIVQNFKAAYGLRSKTVHHGQIFLEENDKTTLKTFMRNLWDLYRVLFRDHSRYSTRADLFCAVDDMKFS